MAEVLRCHAVEVVPYFKPCPSPSFAVLPAQLRRLDFDERPIWRRPYTPSFDPIEEVTTGSLTSLQFLDQLVSRSPDNEALVDVLFALLCRSAFEDAKRTLPTHLAPFIYRPRVEAKLFSAVAKGFKHDFSRVKYLAHLYHIFGTIGLYIATRLQMEYSRRERRSTAQNREVQPSTTTTLSPREPSVPTAIIEASTPCVFSEVTSSSARASIYDQQEAAFKATRGGDIDAVSSKEEVAYDVQSSPESPCIEATTLNS